MKEFPGARRPIRSYVLRQGRVSQAQQRALDTLWPRFGVSFSGAPLDAFSIFGRHAPIVLEIGFGMGESTALIAAAQPHVDFIAVDVHTPGIGGLLKRLDALSLTNVRVVHQDAVELVRDGIAPGSLSGIHVFFPDPWPKLRHHKRRLLQPPFVKQLASRLAPGGYIHAATDWEDYAIQILDVFQHEALLENTAAGYAPRPEYRPLTRFEDRGLRLGHGVWDVVFRRVHSS